MATMVLTYSAERTCARPPQTILRPRSVPLSRLSDATPTRAAIWRAGKRAEFGPPANERRRQPGRTATQKGFPLAPRWELRNSRSSEGTCLRSQSICLCTVKRLGGAIQPVLLGHHHFNQPAATRAFSSSSCRSGNSRSLGRIHLPKRHQYARIERVGLGELTGRTGTIRVGAVLSQALDQRCNTHELCSSLKTSSPGKCDIEPILSHVYPTTTSPSIGILPFQAEPIRA